jgi:hypothetical protein
VRIVLVAVKSPSLAPPIVAKVDIETVGLDATGGHPQASPRFCCDASCAEAWVFAARAIIAKAAILVICVFIKKLVVDSILSAANIGR